MPTKVDSTPSAASALGTGFACARASEEVRAPSLIDWVKGTAVIGADARSGSDLWGHHRSNSLRVECEKLAQRGRVVNGVRLSRQLLDSYGRSVQQLGGYTSHAALDLVAFMIIKMRQSGVQPAQFACHHFRGHGTQRDDGRGDLGGTAEAKKVGNLLPNKTAGGF